MVVGAVRHKRLHSERIIGCFGFNGSGFGITRVSTAICHAISAITDDDGKRNVLGFGPALQKISTCWGVPATPPATGSFSAISCSCVGAPKKQTRLESPENQSTWLPAGENHSTSGITPRLLLPPCRNIRRLRVGLLRRW